MVFFRIWQMPCMSGLRGCFRVLWWVQNLTCWSLCGIRVIISPFHRAQSYSSGRTCCWCVWAGRSSMLVTSSLLKSACRKHEPYTRSYGLWIAGDPVSCHFLIGRKTSGRWLIAVVSLHGGWLETETPREKVFISAVGISFVLHSEFQVRGVHQRCPIGIPWFDFSSMGLKQLSPACTSIVRPGCSIDRAGTWRFCIGRDVTNWKTMR